MRIAMIRAKHMKQERAYFYFMTIYILYDRLTQFLWQTRVCCETKKEPINSSEKFEIHINFIPSYHPIPLAFTSSDIHPPTPIVQDRVKYSKF